MSLQPSHESALPGMVRVITQADDYHFDSMIVMTRNRHMLLMRTSRVWAVSALPVEILKDSDSDSVTTSGPDRSDGNKSSSQHDGRRSKNAAWFPRQWRTTPALFLYQYLDVVFVGKPFAIGGHGISVLSVCLFVPVCFCVRVCECVCVTPKTTVLVRARNRGRSCPPNHDTESRPQTEQPETLSHRDLPFQCERIH